MTTRVIIIIIIIIANIIFTIIKIIIIIIIINFSCSYLFIYCIDSSRRGIFGTRLCCYFRTASYMRQTLKQSRERHLDLYQAIYRHIDGRK